MFIIESVTINADRSHVDVFKPYQGYITVESHSREVKIGLVIRDSNTGPGRWAGTDLAYCVLTRGQADELKRAL